MGVSYYTSNSIRKLGLVVQEAMASSANVLMQFFQNILVPVP